MLTKFRKEHCLQQTCMPHPKIARFSIKMCVSQPDGQRARMLTIFCIEVLGLGVDPAILLCSRPQIEKKTLPIGKER